MDQHNNSQEGKGGFVCTCCNHYGQGGMGGGYGWGGHHHWYGGIMLRIVIVLVIVGFVFALGVKVGEFKANLYNMFGGYGYSHDMMYGRGYYSPMMMGGGGVTSPTGGLLPQGTQYAPGATGVPNTK